MTRPGRLDAGPDRAAVARFTALFGSTADEPPRFLTRADCLALLRRAAGFATDGGVTSMNIVSDWDGELRWARNRAEVTTDRRDTHLTVQRTYEHGASVTLNQLDDAALEAAVRRAEALVPFQFGGLQALLTLPPGHPQYPDTKIWSEATYQQPPASRTAIGRAMIAPAEAAGVLSAGYLKVAGRGSALFDTRYGGRELYAPQTFAECSVTVRDPQQGGSGWAGASSYDWTTFDPEQIAKRALEKCLASRNPVRLEPGRYEVVLEPQAVHDLARPLLGFNRRQSEFRLSNSPYYLMEKPVGPGGTVIAFSKVGLKLLDERITISHDPMDPQLGVRPFVMNLQLPPAGPFADDWEPYRAVKWFDKGVLTALGYDRAYAVDFLHEPRGLPYSGAFRMSGGDTPLEQMIADTRRGLLVTRFSDLQLLDLRSLLYTGLTRDGLWLIEGGKITKPVKNFRFTESPFFAFNKVAALGPPVPVFSPGQPAVVPPLRLTEFSFTSLTDAI